MEQATTDASTCQDVVKKADQAVRFSMSNMESKIASMTRTPRDQLNIQSIQTKRNSKPLSVILKMKPVSAAIGQPNIVRKPQPLEQAYPKRQKSNPQRVKRDRQMYRQYPFYFTKEDPIKKFEAPEWYQKIGKRFDGVAERNTHMKTAGSSFPIQRQTTYDQSSRISGARGSDQNELTQMNLSKIINKQFKDRITKDSMQSLIYDIKTRQDRFEQTSRTQNEKGLGFTEGSIRGNTYEAARRNSLLDIDGSIILPPRAVKDTRFSLPTSVKCEYTEQLLQYTELPLDMRKTLGIQRKNRIPQRKFKSQSRNSQQEENTIREVTQRLTESHNAKISEAIVNRANDEEDNVPIVNPRIVSQFEQNQKGRNDAYYDLMRSYQPGDLKYKHVPMPNKKRFGVANPDAASAGHVAFTAEREAARAKCVKQDHSQGKVSQSSIAAGQGVTKADLREPQQENTYGNTKNYSNINNNYSFQMQLQKQIVKAKKHQPNASLSKLIDLSELHADHKISKDMIIKNIADNFKQHRANLRQAIMSGDQVGGSRTPHQASSNNNQLVPAGAQPPIRPSMHNSVSPSPQINSGSLKAQKQYSGRTSQEEWQMNVTGNDNDWKLLKLANQRKDKDSQKKTMRMSRTVPPTPEQLLSKTRTKVVDQSPNLQISTPSRQPPLVQDPTSTNPATNPYLMSERYNKRDKACSILFETRGAERCADAHYATAHKNIEARARSSTEQHLLPAVQPKKLCGEREFNAVRNKKVSVGAINGDSRPLKYQDFRLRDPDPYNLMVTGKKVCSQPRKSFRHGEVLRDSIQSIHQERIAAQLAQTYMHEKHSKQKALPQFQTLQVFKQKRPACFTSPEDRCRNGTVYNKTIAVSKDLSLMKVTAAGTNRDTQPEKTPSELRQGLLETNFNTCFQKELDQYTTNNSKLFPRHQLSTVLMDENTNKIIKDNAKAIDNRTNWNLTQVSELSRHETPMKDILDRNEADKKLLQQFVERQTKNEIQRRESISSRITICNTNNNGINRGLDNQRLSPAPLMHKTCYNDQMRSGIVLAQRDMQPSTRFAPQRNESSRMSMSLHSEKNKWYPHESTSPKCQKPANLAFSITRRDSSLHANFPVMGSLGVPGGTHPSTATKQDMYETRSATSFML